MTYVAPMTKLNKISLGLLFLAAYLASRFQNLTAIPVFADEAIYIRWSQIIKSVETLRFIPLTDGKQPLFMWAVVPLFKIFSDPLVAGRSLSIISGLGIIVLLAVITYLLTDSYRSSFLAVLIYILLPFSFFFDRLSLADNLLSFWGVLALLLSLLQAKYLRLDLSLILGFILGIAYLTKSPAIFFIVLSVGTVVILNLNQIRQPNVLTKIIIFSVISTIIAISIFNTLRLGPQFHMIAIRNQDYVWPITEIIRHPLDPLKPHLLDVVHIYNWGIGLPLFTLATYCLIFLTPKKNKLTKEHLVLLSWWILPLIANTALAKVFTARYILFTLPPLIILMAVSISRLNKKFLFLIILVILPNIYSIYRLSYHPFDYQLPSTETGYLQDWTSGWGIQPAAQYLIGRSKVANVIVGTEGYFGTLPDGLQIYTNQIPQLTIVGVGVNLEKLPENLIDAKNHGDEVYLLINHSRNFLSPAILNTVTLVNSYPKPGNDQLQLIRL